MRNLWVRFGCFLTGYNYNILRTSSEAAFKAVKKYTAAMLIVCILWFFIGFTFAQRYLASSIGGCVAAGIIAVVIIVQVERQIILSLNPGKLLLIFRFCLAFMMSILGAVIIDQILLEKDIELEKMSYITERTNLILPMKSKELENQIYALDTSIKSKEREKQGYIEEVTKQPIIKYNTSQTQHVPLPIKHRDKQGNDSTVYESKQIVTITQNSVPHPKTPLIATTDSVIADMRRQKTSKENALLNIRPALEKEMKEKTGFLDELKVMVRLISSSYVALGFWLLWILFFLFIEMLVLFSKMGDKASDYEKAVLHHMNLRMKQLDLLANGLSPQA